MLAIKRVPQPITGSALSHSPTTVRERFWCPSGEQMLFDAEGYLLDLPTSSKKAAEGAIAATDSEPRGSQLLPFSALADTPCLVLLGEPGLGKSWALRQAEEEAQNNFPNDLHLSVNLNSFQSDAGLMRGLFDDAIFRTWASGDAKLHLHLDSLDECQVETVALLLAEEFRRYESALHRLFLRVACRAAEWPEYLESALRTMFQAVGADAVAVYHLAPFRRSDVYALTEASGVDAPGFLSLLSEREAVPLALRPITLHFLLNVFARGHFPTSRAELYRQGCTVLCTDVSRSRQTVSRKRQRVGELSPTQKLDLARRIAALVVFGRRSAVWNDVDLGDVSEFDLPVTDLLDPHSGSQNAGHGRRDTHDVSHGIAEEIVSLQSLETMLSSALFEVQGSPRRLVFGHQTYAEFLAADFLISQRVTLPQVWSLIAHPDASQKIVPQLTEVAAWLAGSDPEVFHRILKGDPRVLLRSDVATAEPSHRAALVEALLHLVEARELIDSDRMSRHDYHKLSHPQLADQLRPFIFDRTKDIVTRRVAIDMAESCHHAFVLADELATLALDASEDLHAREQATHAVMTMGDDVTRLRLKPLAVQEQPKDLNDEIKGAALTGLWPRLLSTEELFTTLSPNRNPHLFGAYGAFLKYHLPRQLQPNDLPAALRWCARQSDLDKASSMHAFSARPLIERIFALGWRYLYRPQVLSVFADAVLLQMEHSDLQLNFADQGASIDGAPADGAPADMEPALTISEDKRRLLVDAVVSRLSEQDEDTAKLESRLANLVFSAPVVTSQDIPWMLERLENGSPNEVRIRARLIRWVFTFDLEDAALIWGAISNFPVLAEEFEPLFTPVELSSERAKVMRESHEADARRERMRQERRQDRELAQPPPSERVQRWLRQFENGDLDAWWKLNLDLTLEETSTFYPDELEPELTRSLGWKAADDATRQRILEAARAYLEERKGEPEKWLGTNTFFRPAAAAYRALLLLAREDRDTFENLPARVWQEWGAVTLWYPSPSADGDAQALLVAYAYRHAPELIIANVLSQIHAENRKGETIFCLRELERTWDERLMRAVLDKARDPELRPSSVRDLLEALLEHGFEEARAYAVSLICQLRDTAETELTASGEHTIGESESNQAEENQEGEEIPREAVNRIGDRTAALAHAAVLALLRHAPDAVWSVTWPTVQRHVEWGKTLLQEVAHRADRVSQRLANRLSADALAELFLWLARAFPHAQDPHVPDAHFMSPRESVSHFRDGLLQIIKEQGTIESSRALARVVAEMPDVAWLRYVLQSARHNTLQRTWIPPQPEQILALVSSPQCRLVQSSEQLLTLVEESLDRLDHKLHGLNSPVRSLWDKAKEDADGRPVFRPVDENTLSNYIAAHLRDDIGGRGVAVNREVEIRTGERTDIHVEANVLPSSGEYQMAGVVIEVKGDWHAEVKTAMQTQLFERYLTNNPGRHGLYVVGFFGRAVEKMAVAESKTKNDKDGQQKPVVRKGVGSAVPDKLRSNLEKQAQRLSSPQTIVRAFVLDTSLPAAFLGPKARKKGTPAKVHVQKIKEKKQKPEPSA